MRSIAHLRIDLRRSGLLSMLAMIVLLLLAPHPIAAQTPEWRERRTASFAILYPQGSEADAEAYSQFVDGVYDEVSAIFSYRTPPPVVLRIYPTMELYVQSNPLAAQIPGVIAHAHTGRREISIALPQTQGQTQDQIVNNVRHELTHIIAADLSGDKLTTAFQEGIAQYIEHPSSELDAKMQLMQQVIDAGRLLPWSELNRPGVAYSDPRIGYPESYTIVAFLIQRDGLATFRAFMEQMKTASGYRSALETVYGVSADQLEREWSDQLGAFVAGGYRNRTTGAFDLSQAQALIGRGEYDQAIEELQRGLDTLRGTDQTDLTAQAETLLRRAQDGKRITTLAADARTALQNGDYKAAQQAATEGRDLTATLGQDAQNKVMQDYVRLAEQGIAAQQQLQRAHAELQTLHVGSARTELAEAYATFTRLGDENNAALAQTSLLRIRRTQTLAAIALVVVAALVMGWNIHRRVDARGKALPFS